MELKKSLFVCLLLCSSTFHAVDGAGWSASYGTNFKKSESTVSSNPSKTDSLSVSAAIVKQIDPKTWVGGSLSYGVTKTDGGFGTSDVETKVTAGSLLAMRDIGSNMIVDGYVGQGDISLSNEYTSLGPITNYRNSTRFSVIGSGLSRTYRISPTANGTLKGRLSRVSSDTDSYIDSNGTRYSAVSRSTVNSSIGGSLSWVLGAWRPQVGIQLNHANASVSSETNDRNYLQINGGVGYTLSPKQSWTLGYNRIEAKDFSKEQSLMLSLRTSF